MIRSSLGRDSTFTSFGSESTQFDGALSPTFLLPYVLHRDDTRGSRKVEGSVDPFRVTVVDVSLPSATGRTERPQSSRLRYLRRSVTV